MIPVDQTIGGKPYGNCGQACVASILEMKLDEVPNFMAKGPEEYGARKREFLDSLGLENVEFKLDNAHVWHGVFSDSGLGAGYWIATVPSLNIKDAMHCVVMHGMSLAHDPAIEKKYEFVDLPDVKYMTFIVPKDPSRLINHE